MTLKDERGYKCFNKLPETGFSTETLLLMMDISKTNEIHENKSKENIGNLVNAHI